MARVRSTLKNMEGVVQSQVDASERSLSITFDDRVTTSDKVMEQLAAKGYQIEGQPEVKQGFRESCH